MSYYIESEALTNIYRNVSFYFVPPTKVALRSTCIAVHPVYKSSTALPQAQGREKALYLRLMSVDPFFQPQFRKPHRKHYVKPLHSYAACVFQNYAKT